MTEEVKEAVEPTKEKVALEALPIHELKRAIKEKGIITKSSDSKEDVIKMLRTGETKHKEKEVKRMPVLGSKEVVKLVPMLPVDIKPQLDELAKKGLTWTISEEDGCVTFHRDLKTCANLDQSASNILRTAQQAFRGKMGMSFTIDSGNKAQAARVDNGA